MYSVVIPAYNEEQCITACLAALQQQTTTEPFEVIVVDNNSTDATLATAEQHRGTLNLRVIPEANQGRGYARRTGFAAATGSIILSTDADAVVPPNWIEQMTQALQAHPTASAATSCCRIEDCSPWRNAFFNWFHPVFMRLYRVYSGHYVPCGFSTAVRREVYQQTSGFRPEYDGQEDVDLGRALAKLGPIILVKEATITFSGRRFQHGLFKGLAEYIYVYFAQVHLQRNKKLSNPR